MSPARSRRRGTPIGSTFLAAGLLVGIGALAAYGARPHRAGSAARRSHPGGRLRRLPDRGGRAPSVTNSCAVDWTVLAGIAQVESRHGRIDGDHDVAADGDVVPPIRGRALDGTRGTQTIVDTDGGELDGDADFDRAMGPLQFIPTTWSELGRDGNDDGAADPDNLYDASLTAVAHLCLREPGDYSDRGQLRRALIAYNASGRYADDVLDWIDRYQGSPLDQVLEQPDVGEA